MAVRTLSDYPRETAERKLRVKTGTLSLDQLAERLSAREPESPVCVRDWQARPVKYSALYHNGQKIGTYVFDSSK